MSQEKKLLVFVSIPGVSIKKSEKLLGVLEKMSLDGYSFIVTNMELQVAAFDRDVILQALKIKEAS